MGQHDKPSGTFIGQFSEEERIRKLALFDEVRALGHTDSLAWQLETVKHLVLINGVGLAAAASVVAGSGSMSMRHAAGASAVLTTIGIFVAACLMGWRWIWGTIQARKMLEFNDQFRKGAVPIEDFRKLILSKPWRCFTFGCAGISLLCFVGAMLSIVVTASF